MQVDGVPVFGKDADFVTSKIMGKIGTPIATKFRRDIMILERERAREGEREIEIGNPVTTKFMRDIMILKRQIKRYRQRHMHVPVYIYITYH